VTEDELAAEVAGVLKPGRCGAPGCERRAYGQTGWCTAHYRRVVVHGHAQIDKPLRIASYEGVKCSIDGCDDPAIARGICKHHYNVGVRPILRGR
jgi:hypothetical protein